MTEGHRKEGQGQGQGQGEERRNKSVADSGSQFVVSGVSQIQPLDKIGPAKRHLAKQTDVCYKFQSRTCTADPCSRAHRCIGCNKEGVSYDDCGCLESQF